MTPTSILPIYTEVREQPITICKPVTAAVFDYPFFNDGVARNPFADQKLFKLNELPADNADLLDIKGFIFHSAHCGSTLLSRMLGQLPEVRVVSETEAINGLLLSYILYDLPEADTLAHLRSILEAYRPAIQGEKQLIFKLTSWNVFFIPLFQKLYPEVNWLYIDRETDALVQSLHRSGRGFVDWWDHPVDILRNYFLGAAHHCTDRADYIRQMVEQHRYHAHNNKNEKACFLNYPAFIGDFKTVIIPHFQLRCSDEAIETAAQIARYEAKKVDKVLFKGFATL